MRNLLIATFLLMGWVINAQTILNIEGRTYTNYDDTWSGVNISRSRPTTFTFKNNSITSVNRYGYMLCAGDEVPGINNNNLAGEVITGNKFTWRGSDMTSITHGLFTGHNINAVIKYNYLDGVPMGIIRKSGNNMSNTAGGIAYNIVKGGAVGVVVKGMSNVKIYNNTLYTDRTTSQTGRPLVHIYTNTDNGGYSVSHGTKIFNNIFYTKYQTYCITVSDKESLTGFECDYNVYWCESGTPVFNVNGTKISFAQWQAMGYDVNSVVMNPGFNDLANFVPVKRLDYGKNLGSEWEDGLSVDARWGKSDPVKAAQNGSWQVGAVIYPENYVPGEKTTSDDQWPDTGSALPGNGHYNLDFINLYPTPNDGRFTVSIMSSLPAEENRIAVISGTGQTVFNGSLRKDENIKQLDLSHLKRGFYTLMIIGGEIFFTKKFVKE